MPESENVASARPDCEPLAPAQGLNRRKLRFVNLVKPAFLLVELRIAMNHNSYGCPIGCPKRGLSTEAKPCRNRHLVWGNHRSRTRGSISEVRKIVSD